MIDVFLSKILGSSLDFTTSIINLMGRGVEGCTIFINDLDFDLLLIYCCYWFSSRWGAAGASAFRGERENNNIHCLDCNKN